MTGRWSIEVRGETPEDVATHVFSGLPIAIGRHPSNDLRLDLRFVSSFHARLDESAGRLSVVDLGSTNGVHVRCARGGGKTRIASHEPHDLTTSGGEFCVGAYWLRLFRSDPAGATAPPLESASAALPSLPALPAAGAPSALFLGDSERPSGAAVAPAGGEPSPARSRRAREAMALAALEQLARAFSPGHPLETAADVEQLVRRLHSAVEQSCRGLVRLRRGQRRCASALRLPAPAPAAAIGWGTVEDPAQLARLLLDGGRPAEHAAAALAAEFHALVCHQVALLEGVLEGAGALVGELAPERIEAEFGRTGFLRAWLGRKFEPRWRAYRERHERLSRRDGALSLVFGRGFREAYAAYLRAAPRAREASARRAGKLRQGLLPERRL